MNHQSKNRTRIPISSSSEEESDSDSRSESEDGTSSDDYDDDDYGSDSDNHDYDEHDSCDNDDDNDSMCDKVIRLLRERSDLQQLNLMECKAYLRGHGSRLSGTKADCIERIKEHWRLKDRSGEALYPRSSFTINCTGDACKGDVVLFTQKVFQKFDKVTRRGKVMGNRTIAGRIVKESYGAASQQHTFTVEVLWSKGIKKLAPLFPLLVKGRNLYKLKTFRQPWTNEAERTKVLDEKHRRGTAARLTRASKRKRTSSIIRGAKKQNHFPQTRSSQVGMRTKQEERKHNEKRGKAPVRNIKSNNCRQKPHLAGQLNLMRSTKVRSTTSSYKKHQNFTHPNRNRDHPTFHSQAYSPHNFQPSGLEFHNQSAPFSFPSSSSTRLPHLQSYVGGSVMHPSEPLWFSRGAYTQHAYSQPTHGFEPTNFNRRPVLTNDIYTPHYSYPLRRETYERRNF